MKRFILSTFAAIFLTSCGVDKKPIYVSMSYLDTDEVSGYVASAYREEETKAIYGAIICRKLKSRILEDKSSKLTNEDVTYFPKRSENIFSGRSTSFTGSDGDIIYYDHETDVFTKIGNYTLGKRSYEVRDEVTQALLAFLPPEEKRTWIERWRASSLSDGLIVQEISHFNSGESKNFELRGTQPTWVGFYIEKIDAIAADTERILIRQSDREVSVSGLPQVQTVIYPTNGVLRFTIENPTSVSTNLVVFTNPKKQTKQNK